MEEKEVVKIIFVGTHFCGKSSIILRHYEGSWNENIPPTIGGAFFQLDVTRQNKQFQLSIWDTSGQEKYDALTSSYYKGSNFAILTIDCTNEQSLLTAD